MPKKLVKKETKKVKVEKPIAKPVVKSKPYHLEIRVNDVDFKTDAKDLETALTEFVNSPDFPVGAKTKAFIKYSKGGNERKKIWHTREARRMLNCISLKPSYLSILAEKLTNELV